MEQILSALGNAGLIDSTGDIVLERYPDGSSQTVPVEVFEGFFGQVLDDPKIEDKHAGLTAADSNGDGTAKGYARFFDAWQAAGII